ncbi:LPP20 family lipoprotein [Desulfoplanes sp.]
MRPYRIHLTILLFAVAFLSTVPALALGPQGTEQVGEYGFIDWESMRVRATGFGVAGPNAMNAAHAKILARGAAKVVAQRNLLEVIKGVHIDSETTVKNYMVQDDTIVTRIKGVIKGARIENYAFDRAGACTADISMPLTGELSRAILADVPEPRPMPIASGTDTSLASRVAQLESRTAALERHVNSLQNIRSEQEELSNLFIQLVTLLTQNQTFDLRPVALTTSGKIKELQDNQTRILTRLTTISNRLATLEKTKISGPPSKAKSVSGNLAGYTGLVIDARSIGFKPCLRPKIFGQSKLLYPGSYVDRHTAIRQGYVRFYRNVHQAQQSPLVGNLPLTVKVAKSFKGNRTLFLPEGASADLLAILNDRDNFMSHCKVVIVF